MQTYTYSCACCGRFDLMRSMERRGDPAPCPGCGEAGRRVFTAPHLGRLDPALDRAATRAGLSAEAPEVVSSVPAAARRPVATQLPGSPPLPRP